MATVITLDVDARPVLAPHSNLAAGPPLVDDPPEPLGQLGLAQLGLERVADVAAETLARVHP
jgi:hypothetical protein